MPTIKALAEDPGEPKSAAAGPGKKVTFKGKLVPVPWPHAH